MGINVTLRLIEGKKVPLIFVFGPRFFPEIILIKCNC